MSTAHPNGGKTRSRSSSFERVQAVVRALSRAPDGGDDQHYPPSPNPAFLSGSGDSSTPHEHDSDDVGPGPVVGLTIDLRGDAPGLRQRGMQGVILDEPDSLMDHSALSSPRSPSATIADDESDWIVGDGLTPAEKAAGRLRREEIKASSTGAGGPTAGVGARKDGKKSSGRRRGSKDAHLQRPRKTIPPSSLKSWEIPRKLFHSSIGFLVLYLHLSHRPLPAVVLGLGKFLGVVVVADVIRLNSPRFERIYEQVLGFLMRESEKERVNGVVWYLVGVMTSLHFFPKDIACVSIMM